MYSLVPGGSTSSSTGGGLFSSTEPKAPPRTGKFQKHAGRRVVTSAPSSQVQEPKKESVRDRPKFNGDTSIEELDKMLEDDALALLNIKKEINNSQGEELDKLRSSLLGIRKEYDNYFVANNAKEKELQALLDKYNSLVGVDRATNSTQQFAKGAMNELTEQTVQVLDDLAAEQRTIKMQTLMIKRLDEEIGKCRIDISKANIGVEHAKHDMQLAENNLQINRQYLSEQESQLEKLNQTLKSRKDQRETKISMLHSLSVEGEQSVAKLQHSLMETTRKSVTTANKRKTTATAKEKQKNVHDEDDDDAADQSDLATRAKRLNVHQIKEALQRYQSQAPRTERLHQLDQELRNNIISQQKKKQELSEHLAQTQFKIQQLASSRQIYQEVDLKDSTLAATSKECEESKERDFRLRLSIEELKQSIPRFLTKVTKVVHPKPNENQLGDAILKLEDELTKLIKLIGSALLKDATPDDLAVMSQQTSGQSSNSEANSEFGRLQRLPGFSRMQRQLFYNMMTARPDISDTNIRVENSGKMKKPKTTDGSSNPRHKRLQGDRSVNSFEGNDTGFGKVVLEDTDEPSLGRSTIKNISRLIIDRDGHKVPKTTNETVRNRR